MEFTISVLNINWSILTHVSFGDINKEGPFYFIHLYPLFSFVYINEEGPINFNYSYS